MKKIKIERRNKERKKGRKKINCIQLEPMTFYCSYSRRPQQGCSLLLLTKNISVYTWPLLLLGLYLNACIHVILIFIINFM